MSRGGHVSCVRHAVTHVTASRIAAARPPSPTLHSQSSGSAPSRSAHPSRPTATMRSTTRVTASMGVSRRPSWVAAASSCSAGRPIVRRMKMALHRNPSLASRPSSSRSMSNQLRVVRSQSTSATSGSSRARARSLHSSPRPSRIGAPGLPGRARIQRRAPAASLVARHFWCASDAELDPSRRRRHDAARG